MGGGRDELTEAEQRVLDHYRAEIRLTGRPPSKREAADALGFASDRMPGYYLEKLEAKGYVRRVPGARGVEIVGEPAGGLKLPYRGSVAAGRPAPADPAAEKYIDLRDELGDHGDEFLLRVVGESMREDGILPGDLIVCRPLDAVEDGDRVVCRVGATGHTLKVFSDDGAGGRWLVPRNGDFKPIPLTEETGAKVVGVLQGLLRTEKRRRQAAADGRRKS